MAKKPTSPTYDIELVRSAARGRWPEILAAVCSIDLELLDGQHHPCPRCGGHDRFRMIDQDAGALLCNGCFRDKNGDGFAAVQWARGCKFGEALRLVAEYLGIEPAASGGGKRSKSADCAEHLVFQPWNDLLAATWCGIHKPGITPRAMLAAGGRLARYRGKYTVFGFPHWGPRLKSADPVGWTIYNVSGGPLPKLKKGTKDVEWVRVKITFGSESGLIGPVDQIQAASHLWKTEGPSDLLALLSLDLPAGHIAVTNSNGAGEHPKPWMLELFAGKTAYVIHDADQPGERGAAGYDQADRRRRPGWCELIAAHAAECRHVRLPYPIAPDHGKDLRDWAVEDLRTYQDLAELAEKAEVVAASPTAPQQQPNEAFDDPHRLARINLEYYAAHENGATLRYWRDEWYRWKPSAGCYRKISEKDFRAKVTQSIRLEFERVWAEENAKYEEWCKSSNYDPKSDKGPPFVKKISASLITNVIGAMAGMVLVSEATELGTWLNGRQKERRNYIALRNGILDIDRLLKNDSNKIEDVLLPHSPNWFSTVCLPYSFDPNATCPTWLSFIQNNLESDQERIAIVQEWAGYLLLPTTEFQKFLLMEGEGSNGKSVYMAGITAILGEANISNVQLEVFGDRFSRTDTLGKLANVAGDCEELDKVAEGYIKSFVSGDRMYFDRKGVAGINCTPTARLMISCNERPRFRDRSRGIWRRMILVPWRVTIEEKQKVYGMDQAAWWERSGELPGMLLWAIRGLYRLRQQKGFTASEVSREATGEYQKEMNSAKAFLSEYVCYGDPEDDYDPFIRSDLLYNFYVVWAKASGYFPFAKTTFAKEIFREFSKIKRTQRRERSEFGGPGTRHWVYEGIKFVGERICNLRTNDELTLIIDENTQLSLGSHQSVTGKSPL